MPSRHPFARRAKRQIPLDRIAHEPLLLLKEGHCFRDDVLQICKQARVNPHLAFETGQLDTSVAMVGAGAGVTLLPEMARYHFLHAGVRLIERVHSPPTRTIGSVRARDKYLTPAARTFIQQLKDRCTE